MATTKSPAANKMVAMRIGATTATSSVLGNKTHPANNRSRYVGTIFINSNFS
jgi:hypothetical protein